MGSNPLRTVAGLATGGVSEILFRGQEAEKPLGQMENQKAPPTLEEAQANADKSQLKPKTYGRSGTIKNSGGMGGLASSMLNLNKPTLMGK